jgi:hypothetical protein
VLRRCELTKTDGGVVSAVIIVLVYTSLTDYIAKERQVLGRRERIATNVHGIYVFARPASLRQELVPIRLGYVFSEFKLTCS